MAQPGTIQAHIEEMTTILKPAAKSKATQETPAMPKTTTLTRDEIEASPSVLHADSAYTVAADDDIQDPALPMRMLKDIAEQQEIDPPGAYAPQPTVDPSTVAGQVAMSVDEALERFTQSAFPVLASVEKAWDSTLEVCKGNQDVIKALTVALQSYAPVTPYSASVSVVSPAGFSMVLSVQERSQEAFLTAMGAMMGFLVDNGFQAGPVVSGQGVPF